MTINAEELSLGVLNVLEALYRVEQPQETWVAQLLLETAKALDMGRGVAISLYSAPFKDEVRLDLLEMCNAPDGLRQTGIDDHASPELARVFCNLYRTRMLSNWTDLEARGDSNLDVRMGKHRIGDKWMINGISPSGTGCALWTFAQDKVPLSDGQRMLLRRLAPHLATSYRLWSRINGQDPQSSAPIEAVLTPSGKLEHVAAPAKAKDARETLLETAKLRAWARGAARRHNPEQAVSAWRGLAGARWSFVDALESDGKTYVLARENVADRSSQADLSLREQQVAALARLGRSNKVIAYELGLAAATVRVLMARAARKLGVNTRGELIAALDDREESLMAESSSQARQ